MLAVVASALAGCSGSGASRPSPPASSTTATAATSSSSTSSTTAACSTRARLEAWTDRRLAAQTVVVPAQETDVAAVSSAVAAGVGGVILFGDAAPTGLPNSLAALRARAPGGIAPLVMADEEGGAVQRMANLVGAVPSARTMGATLSAAQIRAVARTLATRLRAAGVTMDLAPVLDADGGAGPNDRDPDGTRSFSADPDIASADGLAFAAGLADGGVLAVAKHFPGLGGATGNTDVAPASTLPWSQLQTTGLVPFERAVSARVPAIMVANADVPGLTGEPASISSAAITGVLRDRLGYRGLVLTDALAAGALRDRGISVSAASVAALRAGADLVLGDATGAPAGSVDVDAIVAAVHAGALTRARLVDAAAHVLGAKAIDLCAPR